MLRIAIMAVVVVVMTAVATPAQEVASDCKSPGMFIFLNLPEALAEVKPSIRSELASVGRMAKANSCKVEVTCVSAPDADSEARAIRNRQCRTAAQLIVRYEQRSSVRTRLYGEIGQTRAKGGNGLVVGTIYVTLH